MTLGDELRMTATKAVESAPDQERCKHEWEALVTVLRAAAKQGLEGYILPMDPVYAYPALAANTAWLRRHCRQNGIQWESRTELNSTVRSWAFFWPAQEEPEPEEVDGKGRTKLRIGKIHLAYVRTDLLTRFRQTNGLVNLTPWLREVIWTNFHLEIDDNESIKQLQEALDRRYFDSCGEWLQSIMRADLLTASPHRRKEALYVTESDG